MPPRKVPPTAPTQDTAPTHDTAPTPAPAPAPSRHKIKKGTHHDKPDNGVRPTRDEIMKSTEYEPYDNRVRPGQTKYTKAAYFPKPFQAMYYFAKRDKVPMVTYPQALKKGLQMGPECLRNFSDLAPFAVNFFVIVYQLGALCVYLIFCASNLKQVVDIHTSYHYTVEMYLIWMLVPFTLICYIKNMKWLAIPSNIANWAALGALCCIYYFTFQDLGPVNERAMFAPITRFPLFMGTVLFSVLSMGPILSVEQNMKNGKYYLGYFGTLNTAMFVVTILGVITGLSGYWKYGEETASSITLNIDITHPVAQAVRIFYSCSIFLSYALQAYPITEILWEQYVFQYLVTSKYPLMWDFILRTILVLFTFILAMGIPRLGLFISLFGAFCLSVLGLIFPPFLDMCTRWPDDFGKHKCILFRDVLFMIFGFIGWVVGTYIAIEAIVKSFL